MPRDRWSIVAVVCGVGVVVELLVAVVLSVVVGWTWGEALDAFVITNGLMGLTFGVCGAVIGRFQPRHPVGWLFLADGLGHATAAMMAPLGQALVDADAPLGLQRLAMTVFMWSWPWSIALFLPMALLLFPDGRLPSRRWRWPALAVIVTAPLFVLELGAAPAEPGSGLPAGYLVLPGYESLGALWVVAEVRTLAALLLAVTALVVRYRRGGPEERHQLQWLLLAASFAVVLVVPWSLVSGTPVVVLLAIPLIPLAVAVAILRHQLFDIRLVVSRALAWSMLTLVVVAAYVLLVTVLDLFISAQVGRSVLATVAVALLVGPVLPRLQRLVDRAMYGDRDNPVRIVSTLGRHLQSGTGAGLTEVAESLRVALRVPYVAVLHGEELLGVAGASQVEDTAELDLVHGQEVVGRLVIGCRPGERNLAKADLEAVQLVSGSLAVSVHAIALATELAASRERLVTAREEERRLLRRELHDGLGPVLTGLAFAADAAANLQTVDAGRTAELLSTVRAHSRSAITDVRRLIDDLRPSALDELGLVGALRQRAGQPFFRSDGTPVEVTVSAPEDLGCALPAALEVAAYRIATESLTNVLRHSQATRAELSLSCTDTLEIRVTDDGASSGEWRAGVGLSGMRERTDELGGRFEAGPSPSGGRVVARFPVQAKP